MPRYFFHFWLNGKRHDDEDGTELADDKAAHQEALETVRELVADRIKGGWAQQGRDVLADSIEVTDQSGAVLITLPLMVAVIPGISTRGSGVD